MTQEEKAKRYDEALEIAKKKYVTSQDLREGSQINVECFKNTLESIFPELQESEDDRIRKELTEFLKKASGGFLDPTTQCKTFGKWRNWLEKQGKPKSNPCEKCNHVKLNCHNFPCIEKQAFDQSKTIFDVINKEN